jgi:hypothetical protein
MTLEPAPEAASQQAHALPKSYQPRCSVNGLRRSGPDQKPLTVLHAPSMMGEMRTSKHDLDMLGYSSTSDRAAISMRRRPWWTFVAIPIEPCSS